MRTPGLRRNDLAYADDGSLWVTDTGPDRHTAHGVLQVDTTRDLDAVYRIAPGRPGGVVHVLARGLHLGRPDGIAPDAAGRVLVSTFGDRVLERVGPADSSTIIITRLPGGRVGDPLRPVLTGVTSPAGIAVDTRRGRLAVTSMQDNALYLVPLPPVRRP